MCVLYLIAFSVGGIPFPQSIMIFTATACTCISNLTSLHAYDSRLSPFNFRGNSTSPTTADIPVILNAFHLSTLPSSLAATEYSGHTLRTVFQYPITAQFHLYG